MEQSDLISNKSILETHDFNPTSIENWHHIVTPPRHPGMFAAAMMEARSPNNTNGQICGQINQNKQNSSPCAGQGPGISQVNVCNSPSLDQFVFQKKVKSSGVMRKSAWERLKEKKIEENGVKRENGNMSVCARRVQNLGEDSRPSSAIKYPMQVSVDEKVQKIQKIEKIENSKSNDFLALSNVLGPFEGRKGYKKQNLMREANHRYSINPNFNKKRKIDKIGKSQLTSPQHQEKKIRIKSRKQTKLADPKTKDLATSGDAMIKNSKIKKSYRKAKTAVQSMEKSSKKKLMELIKSDRTPQNQIISQNKKFRSFFKKSNKDHTWTKRSLETTFGHPRTHNLKLNHKTTTQKPPGGPRNQPLKTRLQKAIDSSNIPLSDRNDQTEPNPFSKRQSYLPNFNSSGLNYTTQSPRNVSPAIPLSTNNGYKNPLQVSAASKSKANTQRISFEPSQVREKSNQAYRSFDGRFQESEMVIRELSQDSTSWANKRYKNKVFMASSTGQLKLHLRSEQRNRKLRNLVSKAGINDDGVSKKNFGASLVKTDQKKFTSKKSAQGPITYNNYKKKRNLSTQLPTKNKFNSTNNTNPKNGKKMVSKEYSSKTAKIQLSPQGPTRSGVKKVFINSYSQDKVVNFGGEGAEKESGKRSLGLFSCSRNSPNGSKGGDYGWYRVNYHLDRKVVNHAMKSIERAKQTRF